MNEPTRFRLATWTSDQKYSGDLGLKVVHVNVRWNDGGNEVPFFAAIVSFEYGRGQARQIRVFNLAREGGADPEMR